MKRALGVAVLGGGLLALNAGAAGAQEVSADVSARLGRSTSAEVRVCADGRILRGLLGSCSGQAGSGVTVDAGRGSDGARGTRARARVPRLADADVSVGARRSRPGATASGQASAARRAQADADAAADTSPRAGADATAGLSRPRAGRLLDLDAVASLAGVGLVGSGPFTLAGDRATGTLLPIGELTLDGPAGQAPAGIGVLESGPIASGNQVGVDVGGVSPSVPVTVCGNGVGVLGDTSASCGTGQPSGTSGTSGSTGTGSAGTSAGAGSSTSGSLLDDLASGNQVDAGIGGVSPSVPVTVCGNSVGVLGDAAAGCGSDRQAGGGTAQPSGTGGGSTQTDEPGNQAEASVGDVSTTVPVTACGNSVGLLGDASASCGADTSSGGIIAPPPGTTPGSTDTAGTTGSTGTSGIPGTTGLTTGTGGGAGDPISTFAPLRPFASGSGALPFTGAASDLLAMVAAGLLAAGALFVRATRPAAATEGGGDR